MFLQRDPEVDVKTQESKLVNPFISEGKHLRPSGHIVMKSWIHFPFRILNFQGHLEELEFLYKKKEVLLR